MAVTQDASLRTTQLPCLYVLRLGLFPHRLWKDSASCSRLSLKRLCRLFCASLIRYFLLPFSSWAVSGPWLTSISSCFLLARNLFFNLKRTTFLQNIVNSGRSGLEPLVECERSPVYHPCNCCSSVFSLRESSGFLLLLLFFSTLFAPWRELACLWKSIRSSRRCLALDLS